MSRGSSTTVVAKKGGHDDDHAFKLQTKGETLDPSLAALFSSSAGPLEQRKAVSSQTKAIAKIGKPHNKNLKEDDRNGAESESSKSSSESSSEPSSDTESEKTDPSDSEGDESPVAPSLEAADHRDSKGIRSRKRKRDNDDLETEYMQKLAKEEAREQVKHMESRGVVAIERPKLLETGITSMDDIMDGLSPPPMHESLMPGSDPEVEKGSRTVFLGNVSTEAIRSNADRRILLKHLISCFTSNPEVDDTPLPRIESLRFRSTAFSTPMPKKAAFAKKELMDTTTKSTNAYVVYSSEEAALKAAKALNGTIVLGRHLRADSLSHPTPVDHLRCVFVGNLGFVDDESQINEAEDEHRKKPRRNNNRTGDVEEGLWQQFSNAGTVESVRVVRDAKTRVGKGFAYVQFMDQNAVEAALLFNDKKYPPLLPRKLRVVRAKKQKSQPQQHTHSSQASTLLKGRRRTPRISRRAVSDSDESLRQGVKRFLRHTDVSSASVSASASAPSKKIVFEGHRASAPRLGSKQNLKLLGKSARSRALKPTNRSAKRGTAWKAKNKSK